jgi:hypothetical protein
MKSIILLIILVCGSLYSQTPTANFSISPNPACTQNVIQILDHSTNAPTAWSYTFTGMGPGQTILAVQNPTIIFNMPGTYTVTLISSNSSGSSLPAVQTLTVLPSPLAQINPAQANNCPGGSPLTININVFGPGGGPYSFIWSTGATTSSISVSPSVTTTYSAIITGTNGCSIQRTSTITVSPATINISSVPANICPGSSSTLTATGTQPGPFTYSWSTGASTRTISTSTPGTYTVTVVNSLGCSAVQTYSLGTSTTLSLTATSNPSVLCAGNTATLRANGATSYTWQTGATTIGTTVNPVSSTTYSVYGELGSCSGTTAITVSVNTTPTVLASASPVSICSGASATLNANGATTYTWSPGGPGQSLTVTPGVNTTYIVSGNNPGCPTRTAAVSVIVNPNPVLITSTSSSLSCPGEVVAIGVSGASSYTWSTGSNSALLLLNPMVTTTYSVTGINSNNCTGTAVITQSVAECAGIDEAGNTNSSLSVYPNPGNGVFIINSPNKSGIELYDLTGMLLKKFESSSIDVIDIQYLPIGIYFLKMMNGNESMTKKLIISR